jgi:uncharacterized membrane protein YjfL (UPF0719 family)
MLKSKKFWLGLLVGILIFLAGLFLFRILTPEDDWVCTSGQWQKHGNPTASMPTISCGRK